MDSHTTPLKAVGNDEVAELRQIALGPEQGCGAAVPCDDDGGDEDDDDDDGSDGNHNGDGDDDDAARLEEAESKEQ